MLAHVARPLHHPAYPRIRALSHNRWISWLYEPATRPKNRPQWRIYIVKFWTPPVQFFWLNAICTKIWPNNRLVPSAAWEFQIRLGILCMKDFQLALSIEGWMESWETRPRLKREPERSDLDLKETTSSFKPTWISRSQEQEENEERAAVDVPASEPDVTWQRERCEGATQGFPQRFPIIPCRTHVRKVSVSFILVFVMLLPPTNDVFSLVCLSFC